MVTHFYKTKGNSEYYYFCKKASVKANFTGAEYYGGTEVYLYDLVLIYDYLDYLTLNPDNTFCKDVKDVTNKLISSTEKIIDYVGIQPRIERVIDWDSIAPETQESTLALITKEKEYLLGVATGKIIYKHFGVEEQFKKNHQHIISLSKKAGFEYPINYNSLAEWWVYIKDIDGYAARTAYVNHLFDEIIASLSASVNSGTPLDFSPFYSISEAIDTAIKDANTLIKEGSFVSAIDRIHTAFHGYLESLLNKHGVEYNKSDTVQTLYSKLHSYYEDSIEPKEIATIVKTLLRGASGIVNSINDIRNTYSVSHPNEDLVHDREAKLMAKLVLDVVQYIEDVEQNCL